MNRFRSTVVGVICAMCVVFHAQTGLTGKWQGETASARPVVLDAQVKGQELTGKLRVGQQSGEITDGKADEKAFSFKVTIEGRTVTCTGRLVGEAVMLTVQDVADPLTLKRVK